MRNQGCWISMTLKIFSTNLKNIKRRGYENLWFVRVFLGFLGILVLTVKSFGADFGYGFWMAR